jgi:allene oxide cyclase
MGVRLVVIEHAQPTVFDLGPTGDSIGDVRVFSNDLYDAENATVVGADQGFCVRTVVGKRMECTWTNIFENGTIVTQGAGLDAAFAGAPMTVAITGGTGDYVGAKGEMTITKLEDADHQFTFTFELADVPASLISG